MTKQHEELLERLKLAMLKAPKGIVMHELSVTYELKTVRLQAYMWSNKHLEISWLFQEGSTFITTKDNLEPYDLILEVILKIEHWIKHRFPDDNMEQIQELEKEKEGIEKRLKILKGE